MWCVHAQRGAYEWLLHPEDAKLMLRDGVILDGKRCTVEKIGEWPNVGRWHLLVRVPGANQGFVDAAAA